MKAFLKKRTIYENTLYISFFITAIIALILGFIYPNSYSFAIISIPSNLFLIIIFHEIMKLLKIKFTKKQTIAIILAIIGVYIFYILSLLNRKFLYFSDFACYYHISLETEEKFSSSLFTGIRYLGGSTYSGEYGNFITFFPELVFRFTNRSASSYLLSFIIVYTPYLVLSISILLQKLIEKFEISKNDLFFNAALLTFLLFPILHATAIYNQPDFFGLVFIFLIMSLTYHYDFKKIDIPRLILIFLTTFMLIISRRWYIYWVLSYYLCYVIYLIISNIKDFKVLKQIIKNILIFGILAVSCILIVLFPMFKNILFGSIGNYSAFYLSGGFSGELSSQLSHLGYLPLSLMIMGIIHGLKVKELRLSTILSIAQYFLMIFLFTRIQNMGLHHSLILLPIYLYFLYLALRFIIELDSTMSFRYTLVFIAVISINFLNGLCNNTIDNYFTKVPLKVEDDENYDQYIEVGNWLKSNLTKENTAYMICHNNRYNPDKFRTMFMPDKTIFNYLPYGSAVIGSHYFPYGLFDAKYILTVDPFESISMEYKYNDVFKELVRENKFEKIKEFDMQDGHTILIYERVREVDEEEKNLYLEAIEEESKLYPELYKDVIENYIIG